MDEFMDYVDKNDFDLYQDPNGKAYFVSSEGIKLPFLLVAEAWRRGETWREEKETLKATK